MAGETTEIEDLDQGQEGVVSSLLDMSDEDFLKQGANLLATTEATNQQGGAQAQAEAGSGEGKGDETSNDAATGTGDEQNQGKETAGAAVSTEGQESGTGTDSEAGKDQGQENGENQDGQQKRGPDGKFVSKTGTDDKQDANGTKKDDADAGNGDGTKANDGNVVDHKSFYEQITAPFKANGRDIRVQSPEEAVRLMQMGANYNKKMAALKPNLAMMKSLENNGLLDPDKINFLIDLSNKNPDAISKLIKDSGIDPMDITAERAGSYKPGNHKVDDSEIELDHVLDELKSSPKFNDTLDVVSKQWDAKSKQTIASQPQLLKVINAHMESGIFDLVASEVERTKLFGGLPGLSDLEAYRQIGDAMAKDGKFDHLMKKPGQAAPSGQQAPAAKVIVPPTPKQADDSKREAQRRAAAPVKGAAPAAKANQDFNPLALSDEEFLKFKPNF